MERARSGWVQLRRCSHCCSASGSQLQAWPTPRALPGPRFFGYAEAGDEVEASIDGTSCGAAVTADADGLWKLDVDGDAACQPADGDMVAFTLNGAATNETETWRAGGTSADQTNGTTLTLADAMAMPGPAMPAPAMPAPAMPAPAMPAPAPADTGNAGLLAEQGTSPWMALGLGALVLAMLAGARVTIGRTR